MHPTRSARSVLDDRLRLIAGAGLVVGNALLLKLGLRKRRDGWRRGVGLVLRGECATFVLSAFGLKPEPGQPTGRERFAARLDQFLRNEPLTRRAVRRGTDEDRVEPTATPSYTLAFEEMPTGPARFIRPDRWGVDDWITAPRNRLDPVFSFVCRLAPGGIADLWVRVNHIATDGVPAQELMTRLEVAWGTDEVLYPTPEALESLGAARRMAGCADVLEVQAMIEFAPVLAWRKKQNASLPEPMTVTAALIWCLSQHDAWRNTRIGTTAEVPAIGDLDRGVGVVVIRPADYHGRANGLREYVIAFNRALELNRRRESSGLRSLDAAALVPPRCASAVLRAALNGDRAFGSMAITMLKDARVFGAPLADLGHPEGFIAIGSLSLPTSDGRRVGCVCVKGRSERIGSYPARIREAIQRL